MMDGKRQLWWLRRICRHAGRCRRELDVGGNLVYVGGLIVVDELAEGGDFVEQCLEGQILLDAVALEGGESLGKGRKTVGVVLLVAGAMVSGVLHGSTVMLVLGVLFKSI